MSKISRQLLKLFGLNGSSDNFGQFGSKVAGSPLTTKDVPTIQALDAWLNGLQNAVVSANKAPYLQDMNALFYVAFYQAAYGLQEGIPEWDANTTYYVGSIAKKSGTSELYMSNVDGNTGNALPTRTDNFNWKYVLFGTPPGTIVPFAGPNVPGYQLNNYLLCNGQAVSRAGFPDLFAAIGTVWGIGDGSTTFNVPDLLGLSLFGKSAGGTFGTLGADGGSETHTHTQSPHTHAIGVLSLAHDINLSTSPFSVTSDQYSQGGGRMGTNPTPSGVGTVQEWGQIHAQTQADNTGSATPVIQSASNVPPFAVVNYIIKT